MADRDTDVFLRIIAERKDQALRELRDEIRALRDDFAQHAREVAGTAVKTTALAVASKGLASVLRLSVAPSISSVLSRLKELAASALRAVNPVNLLGRAWEGFSTVLRRIGRAGFYFVIWRAFAKINEAIQGVVTTLFETAPAFEEVRRGFYNLASAAGTTGDRLMKAMQEASKGTLTQLDLMQKTNYAIEVYGRQIVEYLPELIAGARRASKTLGVDLTYAFNSVIDGMARTSKKILDNVGIVFNASTAYKEYAATLGKTTDELTESEQKAAYLQATLKFLRAQAAALGEDTYTARDAMAAFKVSITDLVTTSFQVFLPTLKKIFIGLNTLVQQFGPPFRTVVAGAAIVLENLT